MNCIAPHDFIGNTLEANDRDTLARDRIKSILCLCGCMADTDPAALQVDEIVVAPLIDGPGNPPEEFFRAVQELKRLAEQYTRVLVHCHAGRSRSATVAARYLMAVEEFSAEEAVRKMKYLHPPTELTHGMFYLLKI